MTNQDEPEDRGLYEKYLVARLDVYTPAGPSVQGSRRTPGLVYQDERGNIQGVQLLDEVTKPGMWLSFDDEAAQDALWVYANSVKDKQPKLAADIKEQITQAVERTKWEYGVWYYGTISPADDYDRAHERARAISGDVVYREPGGEWMFEKPKVVELTPDWADMPENVINHAMLHLKPHEDGRECAYHHRLDKYTFGDNKECLREKHYTINGQLHERWQG